MKLFKSYIVLPFIFFFVCIFLIKDYGISWDEPIHFYRGHAYLHYFLTGQKTFDSLPPIIEHQRARVSEDYKSRGFISVADYRRSYYQDNSLDTEYFLINDAGHPPLNDILAALSNYIFYQKLGIVGDLYSHHLFNIVASTFLVFVVVKFAYQAYGLLPAVISGIVLITYPLFFAESQFNIKDPPQAAFFAASIWAFWNSTKKLSWKWLLASIIFAGISFGMKFNILFLPFIILPYLIITKWEYLRKNYQKINKQLSKMPKLYLSLLILSPAIVSLIFILFWPFLWSNPIENFIDIFGYYKEIGSGSEVQHAFIGWGKFNIYPIYWIIVTTPPVVLLLTVVGIVESFRRFKKKDRTSVLWLIWLIVPIARVSIPGASIYGGIRQIFEYIPAMALLAGLGATSLIRNPNIKIKSLGIVSIIVGFIFCISNIIGLHPNQNVYFNFLVGGLPGAQASGVPYYGNSFGNAYWQAIQWLNTNAPRNAKLGLIQGTGLNIPQEMLRGDIQYGNSFWSGINRDGEYLLELTHDDPVKVYKYAWDYVDKLLVPVYEVKVEGVAIAKLWKNDLDNTKVEYRKEENINEKNFRSRISDREITVEFPAEINLTRFSVDFEKSATCLPTRGIVATSVDGINWQDQSEPVPFPQISGALSLSDNQMNYFFAALPAKSVRFTADNPHACIFQKSRIKVYSIEAK